MRHGNCQCGHHYSVHKSRKGACGIYQCPCTQYHVQVETKSLSLALSLDDTGQMFAGMATIRAAILDVIDAREIMDLWEGDTNGYGVTEAQADVSRRRFVDAVIDRISDWQTTPGGGGVKLENLCDFHKREALPEPTAKVCAECQKKQRAVIL